MGYILKRTPFQLTLLSEHISSRTSEKLIIQSNLIRAAHHADRSQFSRWISSLEPDEYGDSGGDINSEIPSGIQRSEGY